MFHGVAIALGPGGRVDGRQRLGQVASRHVARPHRAAIHRHDVERARAVDGADRHLVLARDGEQDLVDAGIDAAALERVQRLRIEVQPGSASSAAVMSPPPTAPLAAGSTAASTAAPGCTATGSAAEPTPPAATARWRG